MLGLGLTQAVFLFWVIVFPLFLTDISPFRCWKRWLANRSDSFIFTRTWSTGFSKIILSYITCMTVRFQTSLQHWVTLFCMPIVQTTIKIMAAEFDVTSSKKTMSGRTWISNEHMCPLWSTVLSKFGRSLVWRRSIVVRTLASAGHWHGGVA